MILLESVKSHLKLIGCLEWHGAARYSRFSITLFLRLGVISSLIFSISTTFWFLFVEAKELNELSESFVYCVTHLVMLVWYLLFLWKRRAFERFIYDLERKILTSNIVIGI